MVSARKLAVDALCKVEKDNAYSNIVLNELFSSSDINSRDKAFISALFYGVLDRKITVDYYINRLSKVKVRKMNPITRQAIRIGVYQLIFLDKIPQSAAVNESVNIVKYSPEKRNANFVNGILRAVTRELPKLPECKTAEDISVVYSCPVDIVKELIADYGKTAAIDILDSFLKPADVFVRVNSVITDAQGFYARALEEGIEFEKTDDEFLLKITDSSNLFSSSLYKEGYFHVQDIASTECAKSVNAKVAERILDVCAAPGGKSFTIAEIIGDKGEIVSCDLYEQRTDLISKGAKRLKLSSIKTICNDATVFNDALGEFDAVLCDVPCSGWGVMRRKPEIKYKKDTDFTGLEEIQKNILSVSARYVKKGGRLVYSTCTLRKRENEANVEWFLRNHPEFNLKEQVTRLPIDGTDGFYHAVFLKIS